MRDITKKILELNIIKTTSVSPSTSNHWEDSDDITILASSHGELILSICGISNESDEICVSLNVNELDSEGDIYLNNDLWRLYGNELEILEKIEKTNWNLHDQLGPYLHLFF